MEGVIYYDWKYILEVDFANDAVAVKDAYLEYQGFKIADKPLLLRIGNFKTFNTFEEETSANFLDTMERAAFINAWDIDRQIGFGTCIMPTTLAWRQVFSASGFRRLRTRRCSQASLGMRI